MLARDRLKAELQTRRSSAGEQFQDAPYEFELPDADIVFSLVGHEPITPGTLFDLAPHGVSDVVRRLRRGADRRAEPCRPFACPYPTSDFVWRARGLVARREENP